MIICPKCKVIYPDSTFICDCGYNFKNGIIYKPKFKISSFFRKRNIKPKIYFHIIIWLIYSLVFLGLSIVIIDFVRLSILGLDREINDGAIFLFFHIPTYSFILAIYQAIIFYIFKNRDINYMYLICLIIVPILINIVVTISLALIYGAF